MNFGEQFGMLQKVVPSSGFGCLGEEEDPQTYRHPRPLVNYIYRWRTLFNPRVPELDRG